MHYGAGPQEAAADKSYAFFEKYRSQQRDQLLQELQPVDLAQTNGAWSRPVLVLQHTITLMVQFL